MVRLIHPDLYHNYCVFDGKDLPLTSKLADKADEGVWCLDTKQMTRRRNREYETVILPSTVATKMIHYNIQVNLTQFCKTFRCTMKMARTCFEDLGLENESFEQQYDQLFGDGEFYKRNNALSSRKRAHAEIEEKKG